MPSRLYLLSAPGDSLLDSHEQRAVVLENAKPFFSGSLVAELRTCLEVTWSGDRVSGLNLVVPVTMEFVAADLDQGKLFVRYFDAGLVGFGIQLSMDFETRRGCGRSNEIDDCLEAAEGFAAPV